MMWETTVQVTREAVVEAPLERAWSLVSDSAAWSLRPGRFAFDVAGPTGAGRLRCWFVPQGTGLACSVQEVCDEIPGQAMSLRSRGSEPIGRQAFTLSVLPHDRGAMVRLAVTDTALRENKAECKAFWQKDLKAWISALADVIEGRRPWPETGIPSAMWQACAARPIFTAPQGTSVAVLISTSADVVWQAIRAPRPPADPSQGHTVVGAGQVPGSPQQQVGELRYAVVRHADGRLSASASMLREMADSHSALTQRLEPPHFEMQYRVQPTAGGTRLELTLRWPDAPVTDEGEQLRARLTRAVQQTANAYKSTIEQGGVVRAR